LHQYFFLFLKSQFILIKTPIMWKSGFFYTFISGTLEIIYLD
jgi:hypothetical protein